MGAGILFSHLLSFCLCLSSLSLILTMWIMASPTSGKVMNDEKICTNQTKCGPCIRASPICQWCKDKTFFKIRCDIRETLIANGCSESNIVNPQNYTDLVEDVPTSDGHNAVQIKPQRVKLRLRAGEKAEVDFKFYLAQDYAVDMYFLMDLSNTMKVHIEQLANVSKKLVDDIRNLTKSLHVGIGSFVDKYVLPYSFQTPYDFKQMINLTSKFDEFQTTVDELKKKTTENLDAPEAGLDAVLQSIVCEKSIGWRNESRRLIIYSSDAAFHYGGDGKLGGIVIPNDGKCHMKNNRYTQGKYQDYPTVGQIAQKIQENQVTVIFAVSSSRLKTYQNFVKNIRGAYVSELNSQTSTIAKIVHDRYKNISSRVEMANLNKDVDIKFMSKCSGSEWINTSYCDSLKPRQTIDFRAMIPAQKCLSGKNKVVKISPTGMKQQIEIEIEIICGCDCEETPQINSMDCDRIGNLTCGKCYCDHPSLLEKCQMYNTTTECNDHGSCDCGKCFCNKIPNSQNYYNGDYCQCNDFSCTNFNGSMCGGPSRGKCECGKCKCEPEFKGENCGCPIDTMSCMAKNKKICNGYGECECGVCKCHPNSGYKGATCENCPTCGKCQTFEKCVQCLKSGENKDMENCTEICFHVDVEYVDSFDDKKLSMGDREKCMVGIKDCLISYKIGIGKIVILNKQDCQEKINLVALIAGIIGGIFLIGIVLLVLWKVITTLQDRRELAKFNEERDNAKWTPQSNPLYVNASTTFRNPMWNSNSNL